MRFRFLVHLTLFICVSFTSSQNVFSQDFNRPRNSDYPNLPKSGKSINDFVPKDWETVGKAQGDLNGDKIEDCALVIKANLGKFLNKNDGLGSDPFDTNPRILVILFKDKDGYRIAKQSNTFIVPPESPTEEEPFQEVSIKKGVLELSFKLFSSAGSWSTTSSLYRFEFLKGEFVLVGADKTDSMRNSGEMKSRSYNFLTSRLKVTTGNFSSDLEKVRWRTYRLKKLKTLDTFKAPFSWKIEADYYL
ncbi:MAG: hypothetical protein AABM67_14495 [Acidobacteriota bacterium]